MSHVVTLIAKPGSVLRPEEFVDGAPRWLEPGVACDILVSAEPNISRGKVDYVFQPLANREKNLLVADMDSTMINQECIDELADCVGMKAHVAKITERAMNGELDFPSALRERVALLKGLPEAELQKVFDTRITLMSGASTLIQTMKKRGAHTLLVSGGFTFFTSRVARAIGLDADNANELLIENGKLTGTVREPILDKEAKVDALNAAAKKFNIPLERTLAIGDGANDLPMLKLAGLGIAYHAKPVVQQQARAVINHNDLTAVLYALGIPKKDWVVA